MKNTRGIFLVLFFGGITATVYGLVELMLLTYGKSRKYKVMTVPKDITVQILKKKKIEHKQFLCGECLGVE